MAITVFHADSQPMLRRGVTELITHSHDMKWIGSADNGKDAFEKIRATRPNVAVMEIEMAYMNGLDVVRTLLAEGIPTRFVFLTLSKSKEFLNRALEVGIKGYLLKESSENEILECIRFVHEGKAYVNASMSHHLTGIKSANDDTPFARLTTHEINILKLIARQKSSREIADMLFISPKTMANHRSNISKKLSLNGEQNSLLKWALEHKQLLD